MIILKKNADPDNAGQLIYCSELILAHQKKKYRAYIYLSLKFLLPGFDISTYIFPLKGRY